MFEGFSQETVDFMWGIRFNNERSWFEAHKADYQTYFLAPMKELGNQVQAALLDRFPKSGLNLKISRIYRDARRLFGRGPYKDHLWLSLFRFGNESGGGHPVLWFELAPESWSYGMGFWCAQASVMEKHRARIDRDPRPQQAGQAGGICPGGAGVQPEKGVRRIQAGGLVQQKVPVRRPRGGIDRIHLHPGPGGPAGGGLLLPHALLRLLLHPVGGPQPQGQCGDRLSITTGPARPMSRRSFRACRSSRPVQHFSAAD